MANVIANIFLEKLTV